MNDNGLIENENGFVECDTCRAKPGSPRLCSGCLHNRKLIADLVRGQQLRPKVPAVAKGRQKKPAQDGPKGKFRCPRCDKMRPKLGAIYVKWDGETDMLTCEVCAPKLAEERRAAMVNMSHGDLVEEATSILWRVIQQASRGEEPSEDDCRMVILDVLEAAKKEKP